MKVINAKKILDDLAAHPVFDDKEAVHYIGVSGGKDSAACVALAKYAGIEFRPFICDTSHEKGATYRYLMFDLPSAIGQPFKVLKKTYSVEDFAKKAEWVRLKWSEWASPALRSKHKKELGVREMLPPVSPELIERAIQTLRPTGDALRDCLVMHGTMPQKTGKFCSLELKTELAWAHISEFLNGEHDGQDVFWWSGVRAQESPARRGLPMLEPCGMDNSDYVQSFRPIIDLTHDEVFAILKHTNTPINPLYTRGDKRVGCFECFEANKAAIRNSFTREPHGLDRIEYLEREVAKVHRPSVQDGREYVPFFREAYRLERYGNWASAREVFEWSKTKTGSNEEAPFKIRHCDSVYGLCD